MVQAYGIDSIQFGCILTINLGIGLKYYNDLHHKLIPMKRFGTVEEVADLFVFLASEKSAYITGDTVNITGGWYL